MIATIRRERLDAPDGLHPSRAVPACEVVRVVLSRIQDAPVVGPGHAGTAARAAAGNPARHGHCAGWRSSPPVASGAQPEFRGAPSRPLAQDTCASAWAGLRIQPPCAHQRRIRGERGGAKQAAAASQSTDRVLSSRGPFPPAQILTACGVCERHNRKDPGDRVPGGRLPADTAAVGDKVSRLSREPEWHWLRFPRMSGPRCHPETGPF